jgi:hypothetical protein
MKYVEYLLSMLMKSRKLKCCLHIIQVALWLHDFLKYQLVIIIPGQYSWCFNVLRTEIEIHRCV